MIEMGKKYKFRGELNGELTGAQCLRRVLAIDSNMPGRPVLVETVGGFIGAHSSEGVDPSQCDHGLHDLIEVPPYDDIAIDTKGYAWNGDGPKIKHHFAGVDSKGLPCCFADGMTSWTANGESYAWEHFEVAE